MPPSDRLTDSAAVTIYDLERRLRAGFTGEIRLECVEGGVRRVTVTEAIKPQDLPKLCA